MIQHPEVIVNYACISKYLILCSIVFLSLGNFHFTHYLLPRIPKKGQNGNAVN